jgi:hypothetical protein
LGEIVMAIYTRWGSVVTLVRPITTAEEVEKLDRRKADKHDAERLEYGMYAAARVENDLPDKELLVDLGMLRADDGISEINRAARAVGCDPK